MILGPEFVFVENPKTASGACRDTIMQACPEAISVCRHHDPYVDHNMLRGNIRDVRAVVVRNPFDRIVSMYCSERPTGSLLQWLTSPTPWEPQTPRIDAKRTPQIIWTNMTTHILRYENLQEDFEKFCTDAKIPVTKLLVRNTSVARMGRHYRDVIGPSARRIIEDRFAPDLSEFGYTW